ncbi:MAG: hypothetical protein JXR91_07755, partial [Deltaproteobacteria bacterium]|nr:hypothetical protein [Deltaproteobacteria bacterium]
VKLFSSILLSVILFSKESFARDRTYLKRIYMGYTFAPKTSLSKSGDSEITELLIKKMPIFHGFSLGGNIPINDYFTFDLFHMNFLFKKLELEHNDDEELEMLIDLSMRPRGRIPFGKDDLMEVYLAVPAGLAIKEFTNYNKPLSSWGFETGASLGGQIYLGDGGFSFFVEASWLFRIMKTTYDSNNSSDDEPEPEAKEKMHQLIFSLGIAFPVYEY